MEAPTSTLSKRREMTRYFAFLRAINVGGHLVTMDRLRRVFESLGFSKVETFIASGNVIFESTSKSAKSLQAKIEKKLHEELGYEVSTFIRTEVELREIADYEPFPKSELAKAYSVNVIFLDQALSEEDGRAVMALRTEFDNLHSHGREIYWLCRGKQSESTIPLTAWKKAIRFPTTTRNVNTVKRLVTKYTG